MEIGQGQVAEETPLGLGGGIEIIEDRLEHITLGDEFAFHLLRFAGLDPFLQHRGFRLGEGSAESLFASRALRLRHALRVSVISRDPVEHRLGEDEAFELAPELAYHLAKRAYKL